MHGSTMQHRFFKSALALLVIAATITLAHAPTVCAEPPRRESTSSEVRGWAKTLSRISAARESAKPEDCTWLCVELATSEYSSVRREAARTLGEPAYACQERVKVLRKALSDNDWLVREAAADTLARHPQDAKETVDDLITLFKSKHYSDRAAAQRALQAIGPYHVIPKVIPLLRLTDDIVLSDRAKMIIRSYGVEACPHLMPAFVDPDLRDLREALGELLRDCTCIKGPCED